VEPGVGHLVHPRRLRVGPTKWQAGNFLNFPLRVISARYPVPGRGQFAHPKSGGVLSRRFYYIELLFKHVQIVPNMYVTESQQSVIEKKFLLRILPLLD